MQARVTKYHVVMLMGCPTADQTSFPAQGGIGNPSLTTTTQVSSPYLHLHLAQMFLFRRANSSNDTSQGPVQELIARLEHLRLDGTVKVGSIVGFGGYADVYRGTLRMRRTKDVKKVAIKKCRIIFTKEEEEFVEVFTSNRISDENKPAESSSRALKGKL